MIRVSARNVTVDFPVYGPDSRSLKKVLVSASTGGAFARDASDRLVVRALDNVSFDLADGDRVGLIGRNGAGKSTLLRLLAGIYEPVIGELKINGRIASMLSLFLGMDMDSTGIENIYMRGRVMGIPASRMKFIVEDVSEFAGLGDFLHMPMRTYSSGMAMRLAFAVSTSVGADIVLLDEWISAGDQDFVQKSKARLDQFVDEARIVVLASHNLALIKERCNRIFQLEQGVLSPIEAAAL